MAYDYRAEYEREEREYRAAMARLTSAQRDAWSTMLEWNEGFDGEVGIAHSVLSRALQTGTLISQARDARRVMDSWQVG